MAKTGGMLSEKPRPMSSADQISMPTPRSLAIGSRRTHWFACGQRGQQRLTIGSPTMIPHHRKVEVSA
jgi:uncharacterized protein (UPF0248 family)